MAKFKFGENYAAAIGNVRVSETTHHKLKSISQKKGVTMPEVVRVFIDFALEEFEKEYIEHFFPDEKAIVNSVKSSRRHNGQ